MGSSPDYSCGGFVRRRGNTCGIFRYNDYEPYYTPINSICIGPGSFKFQLLFKYWRTNMTSNKMGKAKKSITAEQFSRVQE